MRDDDSLLGEGLGMGGGHHLRLTVAGAAVLLSAASGVVLAAPGASAAGNPLSISVNINSQSVVGSACNWTVNFNVTITNSGTSKVTVTSVDVGSYDPLSADGGLAAGTVLKSGTNKFTDLASDSGTPEGQPCPAEAPDPLVLTVDTSAGSVVWNQSVSDPQAVTMMALPQTTSATLAGSFDVANCTQYYFQYGKTTAYGQQTAAVTSDCPNNGTATEIVGATVTGLASGTVYHYRLVVVESNGYQVCGQDVQFQTGGTTVPVGSVGVIGLAALAGCALFITQRRRRHRQAA
jgi:hypothetical protein